VEAVLEDFRRRVRQTVHEHVEESRHGGHEDGAQPGSERANSIVSLAADQGQEWLQSLLTAGLALVFSDSVRAKVEEEAARGLHALLQETFDALPDGPDTGESRREAQRALQDTLNNTLESLFAGDIRAELQRSGERAIASLAHGEFEAAANGAGQAVEALVLGVLRELDGHWHQVLRLLLKVILKALQEALSSAVRDGVAGIPIEAKEEVEDKVEPMKREFEEKSEALRDQLKDAMETVRDRVSSEMEDLRDRLKDRVETGVKEGTRNQKLGRPPSRGPRRRRSELGRAPNGRPPSGRPPSRGPSR
jgi:HEPN domain-containing protein